MESATRDEIWMEFEKAILHGNFTTFKTKRGLNGYIDRMIKQRNGKYLKFAFKGHKGYFELTYVITPEDVKRLAGQKHP